MHFTAKPAQFILATITKATRSETDVLIHLEENAKLSLPIDSWLPWATNYLPDMPHMHRSEPSLGALSRLSGQPLVIRKDDPDFTPGPLAPTVLPDDFHNLEGVTSS